MSNVKKVSIVAEIDYNFLQEEERLAAILGRIMGNPFYGLKVMIWDIGKRPNEHGGLTSVVHFKMTGEEAVSFDVLKYIVDTIRKYGVVEVAKVVDIENVAKDELPQWQNL